MSTLAPAQSAPARSPRDSRHARRVAAAILLPVAPLSVVALRLIWPAFSATDTTTSLDAVAADPGAQEAVLWLSLHFIAYVVLQAQLLDGFAWGLTALGFAACALVVTRTPDDDWDLAPAPGR
jgi:hypothetical protein